MLLRNLEKRGIVKLQPVGKAYQVSLNKDSYILKSVVEPIFVAEQNTIRALIHQLGPSSPIGESLPLQSSEVLQEVKKRLPAT